MERILTNLASWKFGKEQIDKALDDFGKNISDELFRDQVEVTK